MLMPNFLPPISGTQSGMSHLSLFMPRIMPLMPPIILLIKPLIPSQMPCQMPTMPSFTLPKMPTNLSLAPLKKPTIPSQTLTATFFIQSQTPDQNSARSEERRVGNDRSVRDED